MRILLIVLALIAGVPAAAQGLADDPVFTRIEVLVESDPAAALDEVRAAAVAVEAQPSPDLRVLFDLRKLEAELLERLDRKAEAAAVLERLGAAAMQLRDLGTDPVPLWTRASALYEAAGDLAGALRAEEAIYAELSQAGLPLDALVPTLVRAAGLLDRNGEPARAAELRELAGQARKTDPKGDITNSTGPDTRGTEEGFTRVEVFYATDRDRTGDAYPASFYGPGRGDLDYGIAEVTIPDTHIPGAIETPSVWRLEFGATAARHVMLRSVTPMAADAFFDRMRETVDVRPTRELVVFIHGYNVSFDAAAKRAAQLAYDMSFAGTPVLYSWPSRGSTVGYISDTAVVQLSARRLTYFLDDLVARSGAETIHIVAHSMGNRALTEALELMALRRGQKEGMEPVFDQVVFAAPDVDAGLFNAMMPTIRPLAKRLTLYASENDWALVASRKLHGDAPRAGQGGVAALANPAIDTVDMSELGEDMLAHGYFADDSSALVDLVTLFWRNLPPERRCGLEKVEHGNGVFTWRYLPGLCPDNALLAVLGNLREKGISSANEAVEAVAEIVPDPILEAEIEPVVARLLGN